MFEMQSWQCQDSERLDSLRHVFFFACESVSPVCRMMFTFNSIAWTAQMRRAFLKRKSLAVWRRSLNQTLWYTTESLAQIFSEKRLHYLHRRFSSCASVSFRCKRVPEQANWRMPSHPLFCLQFSSFVSRTLLDIFQGIIMIILS